MAHDTINGTKNLLTRIPCDKQRERDRLEPEKESERERKQKHEWSSKKKKKKDCKNQAGVKEI